MIDFVSSKLIFLGGVNMTKVMHFYPKLLLAFVLAVSMITVPKTANAANASNDSSGAVVLYNPNGGGFLATVNLTVRTNISYVQKPSVSDEWDFTVDVSAFAVKSVLAQCSSYMTVRNYSMNGPTTIPLPNPGSYIGDPNYSYTGLRSNTWSLKKGFSNKIESEGYVMAPPATCSLWSSNSVTDSWTWNA